MTHTDCTIYLQDRGATIADDGSATLLEPQQETLAARDHDVITALTHLGVIRAEGDDVAEFLQGQFSNDIKALTPGQSQLSAYCTPKGRMLALMCVLRTENAFHLVLPRAVRDTLLPRLRMYVLRAKVTLEADEALCLTGLAGPGTDALLRHLDLPVPMSAGTFETDNGVHVLRYPEPGQRFLLLSAPAQTKALWERLGDQAVVCGRSAWEWLDIQAGLPQIYPQTQEAFVPQMANLDLLNGINFKKGCYPGQEIVARMRYLGKLKQRMYRGHLQTEEKPGIGESVYSRSFGEQSAGKIVLAQQAPEGGWDLLLVAQTSGADARDLHFSATAESPIELLPLPYSLSTD